ncbi:MAG: hypothetical protein PVG01_01090 [Desulfobacterales bacterium]|jgi:hypothetical protein
MTTDPQKPVTQLAISGSVKNFATITPKNIRLYGKVGEPVKETVRIVPEDSYPFKILETKAQIGRDIRYELTSEKQAPGGAYLLTVENLKKETGRYYDTIFLVTDSRVKPKISIRVYGKISGSETRKAN